MDTGHVEKAFIFGGLSARSGMTAATMIEAGFTGIDDDLEGANGFLYSRGAEKADAAKLADSLGERFEIMRTNIKKYSVGSPIQAPIDCLANIMLTHKVGPDDFASMVVYTARGEDKITRPDQLMSDLNIRYLLAATLLDGGLTFRAAHDEGRVHRPEIEQIARNITIRANPALASAESPRQGIVELTTRDGQTFSNHVVTVRGVMENPMSTEEVVAKADDLLRTVMPAERAKRAIATALDIEKMPDVRALAALFAPA
jgi:2-methylcitrate dehydratase PrpD